MEVYGPMNARPEAKKGWSLPEEERFLDTADGERIYATRRGAGDIAVVVAHGFSGGHRHGSHAKILGWFAKDFLVVAIDQRGHGKSTGGCTLGHKEVQDIDAAVAWARELGAERVVTVGFSMGSSGVLRQAALADERTHRPEFDQGLVVRHAPDAVVSVGGPAQWWFRGTKKMQLMHLGVATAIGRRLIRDRMGVRLDMSTWPDEHAPNRRAIQPLDPADSSRAITPKPLLVVHGELDDYFPVEHGQRLGDMASAHPEHRSGVWVRPGMLHAERGTTEDLVDEICRWIRDAVASR